MSEAKKVLIIDDSASTRAQLQKIIKGLPDYDVVGFAANGAEGIKKLQELSPDIVCLDIVMPVMDGLETVRIIRQFNTQVRIVMITSRGGVAEQSLSALELGADWMITKPFDAAEIEAALKRPEPD